ncbi:S41 family peptidase [Candidatus Magnetominusculus xianensis]|uniref:Peptidase S41 n=1 Tax=Candidatus Magnetominusculus xianensis TaxID=1748249 RepID=A0ABR5SG04_9BACT|nr:S41 family peptidase [Candidatus Magnetominusculus xianensis]KWT84420.1 peptidase S41 [Candidatus Magnetominusculus xianensis]MBF0404254.1 S41 family peptidase [Nitrospirota bacterium]
MSKSVRFWIIWMILPLIAIGVIFVGGSVVVGKWAVKTVSAESDAYQELKLFTEVISIVRSNYVEEVKAKDLIYGALKGMLNSLDPHSSFMTPDLFKEMKVDTKGEFGGVGIQIGKKGALITVIAPIEDTPAYQAGIKAGDTIVKINGESTEKMTLYDAVSKMRGARGSKVTVTIMRADWKEPKDFTLVRDTIKVKSVKYKVLNEDVGYIKVNQFQEKTVADLEKALAALREKKVTSLLLDLRNDPGGLLQGAVGVTEQFLPPNKLVVYIKDRAGEKKEFFTEGDGKYEKLPMVVMVNEGSASASEIVAGALKDWNRAIILGTTTFGKGSVQSVLPLSDGSGLRLTTARYYTPKGTSIQNTGITPDIVVKQKSDKTKERPVMREKDLKGHLENEQTEGQEPEEAEAAPVEVEEKDDVQLQRAIDILKTWDVMKKFNKAA